MHTQNASYTGIAGPGLIDGQAVPACVTSDTACHVTECLHCRWIDYYNPIENKLVPKSWAPANNCTGSECRPRLVEFVYCTHVSVCEMSMHTCT